MILETAKGNPLVSSWAWIIYLGSSIPAVGLAGSLASKGGWET